ncbi:MAG: hypothetical protein WCJ01_06825 [Ignavibacteria bacterium]
MQNSNWLDNASNNINNFFKNLSDEDFAQFLIETNYDMYKNCEKDINQLIAEDLNYTYFGKTYNLSGTSNINPDLNINSRWDINNSNTESDYLAAV